MLLREALKWEALPAMARQTLARRGVQCAWQVATREVGDIPAGGSGRDWTSVH